MATLTIALRAQPAQTAFNLRRWEELLADIELARIEGRIETDRHGHMLMAEIQEKAALYFDARAREVWLCDTTGQMRFLTSATGRPLRQSRLCPKFPGQVELR